MPQMESALSIPSLSVAGSSSTQTWTSRVYSAPTICGECLALIDLKRLSTPLLTAQALCWRWPLGGCSLLQALDRVRRRDLHNYVTQFHHWFSVRSCPTPFCLVPHPSPYIPPTSALLTTMAEQLDVIAQQFTQYYYQMFDSDRSQLAGLYVRWVFRSASTVTKMPPSSAAYINVDIRRSKVIRSGSDRWEIDGMLHDLRIALRVTAYMLR